jgi:hypothetical protein
MIKLVDSQMLHRSKMILVPKCLTSNKGPGCYFE